MILFLSLNVLWGSLWFASRFLLLRWKQRLHRQPARYISEIRSVSYFRHLPEAQLEKLTFQVLAARKFLLLGDPILGRAKAQGYAWQAGKKTVVVLQRETVLTKDDLNKIHTLKNRSKAERAIVISPFSTTARNPYPGLEILSGKKLVSWMKTLDNVRPVKIGALPVQQCSCGSPQEEHVSRAGEALLICSRYPDCQATQQPVAVASATVTPGRSIMRVYKGGESRVGSGVRGFHFA